MAGHDEAVDDGMVHGRFQPFHNGHLEYVLAAAARCRSLTIGITNSDPTHVRETSANPYRSRPDANPYPFWLRARLVRAALLAVDVPCDGFSIVPFPIHEPELWRHYVPSNVVHFVRVFSSWEEAKVAHLRREGHEVEVLDAGAPKGVTATDVRERIACGGRWKHLVPAGAADVLAGYLATRSIT